MFIYRVTTPRGVRVAFGLPDAGKRNHISLLTGPNGSGKTDVLASVAHVFHGSRRDPYGASVQWEASTGIRITEKPLSEDDEFEPHERIPLIAQTFSPFSRFPSLRNPRYDTATPVFSADETEAEDYSCIGFNQSTRVEVRRLPFTIIQKALLRISDRPSTARVTFDVLDELGFKNGFVMRYRANKHLMAFLTLNDDATRYRDVLTALRHQQTAVVDNHLINEKALKRLRRELKKFGVEETNEFLRHAINMISEHAKRHVLTSEGAVLEYEYLAFQGRHGMSQDFPYLQAFSVLSKLGLLELVGCELTPLAGGRVDLTSASSGQQQMLCSIFGLAAALENDAVVLIDEPELSLHPRWQMNFFRHIETALSAVVGCHVIIATHSPLIAQAAANHGVQISSLETRGQADEPQTSSRQQVKSVEGLLVDVFETPVPNSLHLSRQILKLVTRAESGTAIDRLDARAELQRYMTLYRADGEGSVEMRRMLDKALALVDEARPSAN